MPPTEPDRRSGVLHPITLTHAEVRADPGGVRFLRTVLHAWLQRNFTLDEARLADLTLAGNEALANASEHAYRGYAEPGTIDLQAVYDDTEDRLTVTVTDRGRWRVPAPDPLSLRGRGIPLIRALAHSARIDRATTGTRVSMVWNNVQASTAGLTPTGRVLH